MEPVPVPKATKGVGQNWEEYVSASSLNKIHKAIGDHKVRRTPCIQQRIFMSMSRKASSEFLLFL